MERANAFLKLKKYKQKIVTHTCLLQMRIVYNRIELCMLYVSFELLKCKKSVHCIDMNAIIVANTKSWKSNCDPNLFQ